MNHGDYHADNFVFGSCSRNAGILDFDFCVGIPRIWALTLAIRWTTKERNTEAFSGINRVEDIVVLYHNASRGESVDPQGESKT
jgi:Ser/Thr protein kinase RdoA (MazF antagonist)